jgi:hypothetical protein
MAKKTVKKAAKTAKKAENKEYSTFNRFLGAAQAGDLPKGTKFIVNVAHSEFLVTTKEGEHVFISAPLDQVVTSLLKAAQVGGGKATFADA